MFDNYTLKARYYPMIIFFAPLLIVGFFYSYQLDSVIYFLTSIGLVGAFSYLFSQMGRDLGKKKEARLWKFWGGSPTTQLFRIRNNRFDRYTKERYHEKMQRLCPVGLAPNTSSETNDPMGTDEVYIAWTKYLITQTRDGKKYPLLLKENISYGFRRNLWGLKSFALVMIIALLTGNYFFWVYKLTIASPLAFPDSFRYSSIALLVFLLFWVFVVSKQWVRVPAFSYAERLCEAIDTL